MSTKKHWFLFLLLGSLLLAPLALAQLETGFGYYAALNPDPISSQPTTPTQPAPTPVLPTPDPALPVTPTGDYVPDKIIVKFADSVKLSFLLPDAILGPNGEAPANALYSLGLGEYRVEGYLRPDNLVLLKVKAGQSVPNAVIEVGANYFVEYAEPNYLYSPESINTNDPDGNLVWALENTGKIGCGFCKVRTTDSAEDMDMDVDLAWDEIGNLGSLKEIVVAVVDTGVDYNHEDLKDAMWDGSNCLDEEGKYWGNCKHGYAPDAIDEKDPLPIVGSNNEHGTGVAGVIAATRNNNKGILGIAPNAKIMAINYSTGAWGYIKGIKFAHYNDADIINMSFGLEQHVPSVAMQKALEQFGVDDGLMFAAAGNQSTNNDSIERYPCNYDIPGLLCVANINYNGNYSVTSNYGNSIDLGAPGSLIFTTKLNNRYDLASGTSYATPAVAGVAALVWGYKPELTNVQLKDLLLKTVTPLKPNSGKYTLTNGMVNAYNAITECYTESYRYEKICKNLYNGAQCGVKNFADEPRKICAKDLAYLGDNDINCGNCKSGQQCVNNYCVGCKPETDIQLCTKLGANCGKMSILDTCNNWREIDCGDCDAGYKCISNVCKQWKEKTQTKPRPKPRYDKYPPPPGLDGGPWDDTGLIKNNGGYYRLAIMGSQVWLQSNINYGNLVAGNLNQNNEEALEQYCLNNKAENCQLYGGLYQWAKAMDLPYRCNSEDCSSLILPQHQGQCPDGFHVPSDPEWSELESWLADQDQLCEPGRNDEQCYPANLELLKTGDYDFQSLWPGYNKPGANPSFLDFNQSTYFLSATQAGSGQAYGRFFNKDSHGITRLALPKTNGYSLRCIMNCTPTDGVWSEDWINVGACGEYTPGKQLQEKLCLNRSCGGQACLGEKPRQEIACDPNRSCNDLVAYSGGPANKYGETVSSGNYYRSVRICGPNQQNCQCWLQDNLNVGTFMPVVVNNFDQSAKDGVQKFCMGNDPANCNIYGGLYQAKEAFGVSSLGQAVDIWSDKDDDNKKGLCPAGWHIPSQKDWSTLQKNLGHGSTPPWSAAKLLPQNACPAINPGDCGQADFEALMAGGFDSGYNSLHPQAGFGSAGSATSFMTQPYIFYNENNFQFYGLKNATVSKGDNNYYFNYNTLTTNAGSTNVLTTALLGSASSIRCIKDPCTPKNGGWSDWQDEGICNIFGKIKQVRTCSNPLPACGGIACTGESERWINCKGCGQVYDLLGPYDSTGKIKNYTNHYRTIQISGTNQFGITYDRCWFRDDYRGGVSMGLSDMTHSKIWHQPYSEGGGSKERYCYGYLKAPADRLYGDPNMLINTNGGIKANDCQALYQWTEAMQLPEYCRTQNCDHLIQDEHQGICPSGWHIPTDEEWHRLELYLSDNPNACDSQRNGWACPGAGSKLKGDTAFDPIMVGYARGWHIICGPKDPTTGVAKCTMVNGAFYGKDSEVRYWSATQSTTDARNVQIRALASGDDTVKRTLVAKEDPLAIRCVKDSSCVSVSDWLRESNSRYNPSNDTPEKYTPGKSLPLQVLDSLNYIRTGLKNYFERFGFYPFSLWPGTSLFYDNQIFIQEVPSSPVREAQNIDNPDQDFIYSRVQPYATHPDSYTINYYLPAGACDVNEGYYTATPNSHGFSLEQNSSLMPPDTTVPPSDNITLDLTADYAAYLNSLVSEQIQYINTQLFRNQTNQAYSDSQLSYIVSPEAFVLKHGFVGALQTLGLLP